MNTLFLQDDVEDLTDLVDELPQGCVDLALLLMPNLSDDVLPEDVRVHAFVELRQRNTAAHTDARIVGLYALELEGRENTSNWRAILDQSGRGEDGRQLEVWVKATLNK
jgi:hypothetical protein